MLCPKPPPLLCGLSGTGETALGAGELVAIRESPSNRTMIAQPTKIVPPKLARRSDFSSGLEGAIVLLKPYKSSASRSARADFAAPFLRCSSQQKCGSFSFRKGLIFFRDR